ncbi:hypothetical protein MHBO_000907 [Bonamia ostreae]|uniref:F-actin-capping protein subunit beta n=1 Tax=Bonamia ostreae TaxID=126728 RepID=A0ABV2AH91_9EUKA
MSNDKIVRAMNIIKRMPPKHVEKVLKAMINIAPDISEELLQYVDQPLKIVEGDSGRPFVICDFNRDGDSYRSPHSNKYHPPPNDFKPYYPPKRLREMEVSANAIFDQYRHLYYQGGVSSVYFWDLGDKKGFASCWLVHKMIDGERDLDSGYWDSIHVFEVLPKGAHEHIYQLTTTVMVEVAQRTEEMGPGTISGSKSRQLERVCEAKDDGDHIANLGSMLEDNELDLRNAIQTIYIQKTREVIGSMLTFEHDYGTGDMLGDAIKKAKK